MITRKGKEASAQRRGRFASAAGAALYFSFLFCSFSFASSPPSKLYCSNSPTLSFYGNSFSYGGGPSCFNGPYYMDSSGSIYQCSGSSCSYVPFDNCTGTGTPLSCSSSAPLPPCSPAPGEPVFPSMSTSGSFCDPNTDCVSTGSQWESNGTWFNSFVTNGKACSPTVSTVSPTPGTPCPSGYSPLSNGCECVSSSGTSYVSSLTAASNSACNGGFSGSVTGSPTAPVSSTSSGAFKVPGTDQYCPAGFGYFTSSSGQVSCVGQLYTPTGSNDSFTLTPAADTSSGYVCPPGDSSIGSGSSMQCVAASGAPSGAPQTFTTSPASSNSNGVYYCPVGDSSIGSGSSMECISTSGTSGSPSASGPYGSASGSSSGTASTGSSTASTGSGSSYPSSLSTPGLSSFSGIQSISLSSSIPQVSSTSSGYSCPSSLSFTVFGKSFSISFSPLCTVAGDVRPVVVGAFSLSSLMLIAR